MNDYECSSRLSRVVAVATSLLLHTAACAGPDRDTLAPDATMSVAIDPAGTYSVRSTYALASVPTIAVAPLAELTSATDGPDDPARFLVDRLVERLPEGRVQILAAAVAPYLAAYVQQRLERVAPDLAEGLQAIGDGLAEVARHFGTTEQVIIAPADGSVAPASGEVSITRGARRVISGLRFGDAEVALAPNGLPHAAGATSVTLARDRMRFAEHAVALPYGDILRLGLDHVVLPRVVPGSRDLAGVLGTLVDCDGLGALVAEYLGVGEPALYAGACRLAMTRVAVGVYDRLAVGTASLVVGGETRVIDHDGDGTIEVLVGGAWSGTLGNAAIAQATFDGTTP